MKLKLHEKKDNDTRRQYLHFIDYRFYSFFWSEFYFPHKLFISYTDSYIRLGPPALVRLRWPEPIYVRVGYVFESRFSAGNI